MAFMHMNEGKDLWQYYNEDENKEELTSFQNMFDEITRTGPLSKIGPLRSDAELSLTSRSRVRRYDDGSSGVGL
jgi:hypothetical protein